MMSLLRVSSSKSLARQCQVMNCCISSNLFKSYNKTKVPLARKHTKVSLTRSYFIVKQKRCFYTTPRRDIPPVLAVLLRPIIRISAFFFGKFFKKWWAKKSPEEKQKYREWIKSRQNVVFGTLGCFLFAVILYYLTHIERDPLTNRRKFIMFNKEQQEALAKITFETHLEQFHSLLVTKNHPAYARLQRVTERLLNANKHLAPLKEKTWTLTVVNSPLKNAYVLPGGNIFVFTGIFDVVENDDQLAIVLAHEMAHALLSHSVEQISNNLIMDILLAIPLTLLWAIFPDLAAVILQFLLQTVVDVFHSLPYSRALESEADDIGLKLAACACVDVREAVVFWAIMKLLTEMKVEPSQIPWLSTHPDHGDREASLNQQMPQALALRKKRGCPPVDPADPREKFYRRSQKDRETRYLQQPFITV